jgi:hypothetical protein
MVKPSAKERKSGMNWIVRSLCAVGGVTAALQVSGGVLRVASRLAAGEYRAAVGEATKGLLSPLRSACAEALKLVAELRQRSKGDAGSCDAVNSQAALSG